MRTRLLASAESALRRGAYTREIGHIGFKILPVGLSGLFVSRQRKVSADHPFPRAIAREPT